MKIVIEKNIPFIKGLLEPWAEISYLAPEEINRASMADADALITRTRTRCDKELLEGSRCRFIATATIGTDHIDLDYCKQAGITVANAPGCNAPAVAQYVFASIAEIMNRRDTPAAPEALTLGVVGVGNVGGIVARWGRTLGMNVLCCDPPRAENEGAEGFTDLDTIARQCDVITFHTPLTRSGAHPTFHMADKNFFDKLAKRPVVINSARGPVIDNEALIDAIDRGQVSAAAIDCWEGEPHINRRLLDKAVIATPHIAGYSREGKVRATAMALKALTGFFNLPDITPEETVPAGAAHNVTLPSIAGSYSPAADTTALKTSPDNFEALRNHYALRHEVPETTI